YTIRISLPRMELLRVSWTSQRERPVGILMERKKGLPSYPGSRSLYVLLTILIAAEAFAIILQAIFLARSVTFLFEGSTVSAIGQDLLLFMLSFLMRHV